MTPELTNGIVTIILALISALGGGLVSARLTKTGVELNYKQLFEDATLKANRLSDKVDVQIDKLKEQTLQMARDAITAAEREAKNALALAALTAKFEMVESQRIEQEKRHAGDVATLNTKIATADAKIATLEVENATVKADLNAAMSKLAKTEQWVDLLQTRLNPPPLSEADTEAIQDLRDAPPASA